MDESWKEWSKYVLKELERLNMCYISLDNKMSKLQTDVAMLKVKAGVWGAIAGMIPVVILLVVQSIK